MTVFSKIINGEIPGYIIKENEQFVAFLDAFPIKEGHVLVVPKQEIDRFFDMPETLLREILVFAQPIAKAIEATFDCKRCGITAIGLEVPHAHLHLVPINSADDLNFTRTKLNPAPGHLHMVQQKLIAALAG